MKSSLIKVARRTRSYSSSCDKNSAQTRNLTLIWERRVATRHRLWLSIWRTSLGTITSSRCKTNHLLFLAQILAMSKKRWTRTWRRERIRRSHWRTNYEDCKLNRVTSWRTGIWPTAFTKRSRTSARTSSSRVTVPMLATTQKSWHRSSLSSTKRNRFNSNRITWLSSPNIKRMISKTGKNARRINWNHNMPTWKT